MSVMNEQPLKSERACVSRSALELFDSSENLDADTCWQSCLDKLNQLGVNSVFYGFITSKVEIERQGMTKACHYRTNHNRLWFDALGGDALIDSDLTAELIATESEEVFWFDKSLESRATPEQLEQWQIESELGLQVGVTVQLEGFSVSPVMSGVGLCTLPVSTKEFPAYWSQNRTEVLDICHALDFSMRSLHTTDFLRLSPRELEFLTLLAGGYAQKQIAAKWKRSLHTLDHHSRNCRQKLKAGNLEQAVYKAFVLGLIKP